MAVARLHGSQFVQSLDRGLELIPHELLPPLREAAAAIAADLAAARVR
jgi:hypothetical protein